MKLAFETLASGYELVEGPRPDGGGGWFFSAVLGGGVYHLTDAGVETVIPKRRGVGGLVPHANGGLVVTGRDVICGERVVVPAAGGLLGFNDLVTSDDGGLYVGGLRYNPLTGGDPVPGEVWRVEPGGEARPALGPVTWSNGIGIAPDGGTVYVSDYATGEVLAFDPDGADRRVLLAVPAGKPDGLAVAADGDLWVALGDAKAIGRFDPAGRLQETIEVPGAAFVASLAFDGTDLLVATWDSLLRAPVETEGRPVPPARV